MLDRLASQLDRALVFAGHECGVAEVDERVCCAGVVADSAAEGESALVEAAGAIEVAFGDGDDAQEVERRGDQIVGGRLLAEFEGQLRGRLCSRILAQSVFLEAEPVCGASS